MISETPAGGDTLLRFGDTKSCESFRLVTCLVSCVSDNPRYSADGFGGFAAFGRCGGSDCVGSD